MPDGCKKSRAQLLGEVQELRERIDELEAMASQNRRSAEIARPISASIPCVTYRCAPNKGHHTALAISDYVEQLTGYPASDFIDSAVRTWDSIVHRGDIENIDQLTKKAAELEEPWVVEYRIHCKDGSIRWVHERGMYVDDEDGVSKILEGVVLDVTERKEAEYRLWESERQSRAWLEFSPACTKIIDLDFNLQYMSNAGVKGLRIDDITPYYGKPYPLDFYPGSFRDQMISNLKKVKETGEIATQEGLVLDVEGNEMWFHSTLVPVNNDEGRIDYFIVVSIDITERKRAEKQRISLERQVQHAQKLESLGVLSGGIAHDFNNILMSILGNADLALDALSPHAPARANIQEIETASKRAADLAKQMLAYSGKGRFVIEQINLDEFVNEMVHLLEVSISKMALLKYSFAENLPPFDGDATQIRQVIMNLITNASEAIGDKSGIIALSTGAMECDRAYLDHSPHSGFDESVPEGIYAYLEVADTGCGMDRETVEKIFDPFFTTKFAGRGLGMSAVLGIMRGHKGTIRVYSEPGKGTTFRVLFPTSGLLDNSESERRKSGAETEDWCGRGTVMIADDEETVCAVGKQMLERLGFSVLTACDGRDAIEVFREHAGEIVAVLLDLTMPHLDGEQTFREIRRIRPDIPVILSSGYNMQDATQRFAGKGLAGFIQKPYDVAALREKLMEVLVDEGSGHVSK